MPDKVLTSLNWLDLLMTIVLITAIYRGAVQGFVVEIFKVLGTIFATVLSLHYYSRIADYLQRVIALPVAIGEIAGFVLTAIFIILIFRLVCQGLILILKIEAKAGFNQWAGFLVGIFHGFMICGLLFFGFVLLGNQTLNRYVAHSMSGYYLCDLSPNIYRATYEGLIVRFFPDEQINNNGLGIMAKESILLDK